MIDELRRRAYLSAMQVVSWLPRQVLPFAGPARPEWQPPVAEAAPQALAPAPQVLPVAPPSAAPAVLIEPPRARIAVPRPAATSRPLSVVETTPEEVLEPAPKALPPPRFSLQLLRAGSCALLVELPSGEVFARRDPAYLLLQDLLRAAGLPPVPQVIGEPVRWPLLVRGNMDQGPQAALEFIQSYLAAQLEQQERCACVWLVGLPAIRYAGEADESAYNSELQVEGVGVAWALPGLELLMEEPQRKAALWQSMRRLMTRWNGAPVDND